MRIGITDCFKEDKFKQYEDWIHSSDGDAELVTLSHELDNAQLVGQLDGIVLTGGGDVHPKYFNRIDKLDICSGVNERRDEFEFEVINAALDAELPILGVCRGMQVMNVFLGGSLHIDLVRSGFDEHSIADGVNPKRHSLSIVPHSTLHLLTGSSTIDVNSFHHQAVEKLGNALVVTAISNDGVIEATEWALKDGMPFLMLVQWHPERERESTVSKNLIGLFLREVHQAVPQKTTTTSN